MAVELREHLDVRPHLLEPRRADEDGAKRSLSIRNIKVRLEPAHRLVEAVQPHEPPDCRRLATGDDEPVEPVELLGKPHLHRVRAEPPQHRCVLPEVPLYGENADPERLFHALDGNGSYAGGSTTGAGVRRPRPARPSRTSQKPSSPKASAGAQGLTWAGTVPLATSPRMLVG